MRIAALMLLAAVGLPVPAMAVTPEELVRLHRAGLGDDVLLALVDATGVQGRVAVDESLELRHAGLSDRVIAAAIRRSAADAAAESQVAAGPDAMAEPIPPQAPEFAPATEPPPVVTQVVPVVVPWVVVPPRAHGPARPTLGDYKGFGRFINTDLRPLNTGFIDPPDARTAGAPPPRR